MKKYDKAEKLSLGVSEATDDSERIFTVPSESNSEFEEYKVRVNAACECASAKFHRGYCKHIMAVMINLLRGEEQ